ncbi:MAG: phenylacetate--CoA ligase [Deltaproteobacteria bacterium]|nr:phenylacetate--CoA ligase [Deltaproteobacteria bacterium]MBW2070753.1 phenylacetate--CoA ligase [Deltaproteobacteria bacterium]
MNTFWDEKIETLPREQLAELQLERLQMTINRAYTKVDFYRQRFEELGIMPEDILSLEDLQQFPLTTAADLATHYPYGLFSVPLKSVVRLKFPAASRGRPFVVGYTKRDVAIWQQLVARALTAVNIGRRDIVQVAFNYSLFTGAFTFNQAAELLGATVAPTSIVSATLQLQIMQDFRSTVLATSPSFAFHIADTMERKQTKSADNFLHTGVFGPECMPAEVRSSLEQRLGLQAYAIYGVNEMVEPGVAFECVEKDGLHLAEDHFYPELIDPLSGDRVPPGQQGELVVTTLTIEGFPLIRFRTGDITILNYQPCQCGRSSVKMAPPLQRSDSLLTVRGIGVYPEHLGSLLQEVAPEVSRYRFVVRRRHGLNDQLEVQVGVPVDYATDWYGTHALADRVRSHLRRSIGLGIKVRLVEAGSLTGMPAEVLIEEQGCDDGM